MSQVEEYSPFKKAGTAISTKTLGDVLELNVLILNMTISSDATVNVQTGYHLQYLTAGDNVLTIDGILQVDGSFVFADLGA